MKRIIGLILAVLFLTGASVVTEQTQFLDDSGKPIVNGSIYIGVKDADPEVSPITIYSDRELTSILANPQTTDSFGRATNKIWVPGRYSIKVENSAGAQKFIDLDAGESEEGGITNLTNVLGANTITAEGVPAITVYTDRQIYSFTVASANTGAVTLNIDSLGAKTVKRMDDGEAIASGEFQPDMIVNVQYNSAHDVMSWLNMPRSVTGPNGAVVDGRVPAFSGTSGVKVVDSGKLAADVVESSESSTTDTNVVLFDGPGGKTVQEPATTPTDGLVLSWLSGVADWREISRVEVFTSSGTYDVGANTSTVFAIVIGSGAGGGATDNNASSVAGGGGAGAFKASVVTVTPGGTVTVTVGAAGSGGAGGGANGGNGAQSAFGGLQADGGTGGLGAVGGATGTGGAGASATAGAESGSMVFGQSGTDGSDGSGSNGGNGGCHFFMDFGFGPGGAGATNGGAATHPGCAGGGSGASGGNNDGGSGAAGLVVVFS